jgi:hypothetical protein
MAVALLLAAAAVSAISVGDKIPSGITLDYGFPPDKINLASRIAGKKVWRVLDKQYPPSLAVGRRCNARCCILPLDQRRCQKICGLAAGASAPPQPGAAT